MFCVVLILRSEFGADSDDDSYDGNNDEELEKLKRRKFIMKEFKRRNPVSIAVCFMNSCCLPHCGLNFTFYAATSPDWQAEALCSQEKENSDFKPGQMQPA